MALKGTDVVELVSDVQYDGNGDPIPGSEGPLVAFEKCAVWPRQSTEGGDPRGGGVSIVEGWNLWIPPQRPGTIEAEHAVTLKGDEQLSVRGDLWAIEGVPAVHRVLRSGKLVGTQAVLRRVR